MVSSPWRSPILADLTFGQTYRLVNSFLPFRKLRILDIGCARGFLSLELARNGHDVLGIDLDKNLLKTAKQTMATDPYRSQRGSLVYQVADFSTWENQGKMFDVAIFSRSLHHIPKPGKALDKIRQILSPRGRIICLEYAYDRFDNRSANWFFHERRILEQAGWYESNKRLSDDMKRSGSRIMKECRDYGIREKLNRFEQMYKPLKQLFTQRHFSWEPYIFWDIIADMRVPYAETEAVIARSINAIEKALIRRHAINPTLFVFVGQARKGFRGV